MAKMKFKKELYPKVALIKAAYNFTDTAYIHLDSDDRYYYVEFFMKNGEHEITEKQFLNEMLAQSVRHEVYRQTKDIRELLLARALATSVIYEEDEAYLQSEPQYNAEEILKDWFDEK